MDPIKNPFSPGAGSPPPELAGRAPILEQARVLLGRVLLGKPEKSLMLTGLRGVGKTVLLNEVRRMAQEAGYNRFAISVKQWIAKTGAIGLIAKTARYGAQSRSATKRLK